MSRNRERDEALKARYKQSAMESAFRLFSEKGIDPVKMADIVEACGISRQSLYRYFSSKTDLVIAIGTSVVTVAGIIFAERTENESRNRSVF